MKQNRKCAFWLELFCLLKYFKPNTCKSALDDKQLPRKHKLILHWNLKSIVSASLGLANCMLNFRNRIHYTKRSPKATMQNYKTNSKLLMRMYSHLQVKPVAKIGNSQKNEILNPWPDFQQLGLLQLQQRCLHL